MNKYLKIFLFGAVIWVVPFVASFLIFDVETKNFIIDEMFYKSIMIVGSSLIGVILLVNYFKVIDKNYVREGIVVGLSWFIINILLDVIFLLPMAQMDFGIYFQQIGMRYLIMPIISTGMGYIARK